MRNVFRSRLRDARGASKENLLFRTAKHVFIWFVSLSRDKEMNTIIFPKKTMFAILSLLSKSLLITKKERTNYPTEQPVMFISLSNDKETNQMKACFAARNSKFFLLAKRASRKARTKNVARTGLPPLRTLLPRVLTPTLRVG